MSRTLALCAAVALLLVALPAPPSVAQPAEDPLEVGRPPTPSEIAASITAIDLESSVTGLERPEQEPGVITLESDILFAFGSAELSPAARAAVADIAGRLTGTQQVQVVGHTDSVGSDADNLDLSQRRADAVAAALREALTAGSSIEASGRGETEPVASNESGGQDDPAGRAKNRRVEIRTG